MEGCVFCRIVAGEIPAQIVYSDDHAIAFRDIHPVAPFHVLVVPRKHIASVAQAGDEDSEVLGRCLLAARNVAREAGIADAGFRTIVNTGSDAGQTVFHLHLHVLGRRMFEWP
jgi:histidine triad (HIT) family protein